IPPGADRDFDAKHTDAVTGYYFPERKEFLYFYMGYPLKAQPREISPFGSAQAVATQKLGEKVATKGGVILEPCQEAGHWASGWVGGLQLLHGAEHRWVAVLNASPPRLIPARERSGPRSLRRASVGLPGAMRNGRCMAGISIPHRLSGLKTFRRMRLMPAKAITCGGNSSTFCRMGGPRFSTTAATTVASR